MFLWLSTAFLCGFAWGATSEDVKASRSKKGIACGLFVLMIFIAVASIGASIQLHFSKTSKETETYENGTP